MSVGKKQNQKPNSGINDFPDPRRAEIIDGVIAVGGYLDGVNLQQAYAKGIFPWPHEGYPLLWFCPDERGVLDFAELHVSQSLKKWIKKNADSIKVTVNTEFEQVIRECQKQKRSGQKGSWITAPMIKAYTELYKQGGIISIECWQEGNLISGIYGVLSSQYVSCESMFFKKPNASKYAFVKLVEYLQQKGFTWMDLQMVTDVSGSFGGKYISRDDFLNRISTE